MVKIKEIKKDIEETEPQISDDSSDSEPEEQIEDEGGIFDEDFEESEEEEVSDFDIGTTILSVAPPVESWSGQNLEDTISRERVEKDWGDDEEFVGGGVYKPESGDVYSTSSDAYSSGDDRREDIYGTNSGAYDSKKEGSYSAQGGVGQLKSYDQFKNEHRGAKSMLEITTGLEDKGKEKHKDFVREFSAYDAKKAA